MIEREFLRSISANMLFFSYAFSQVTDFGWNFFPQKMSKEALFSASLNYHFRIGQEVLDELTRLIKR